MQILGIKNILPLVFGSAASALLNLLTLTVAASRIDLMALDIFFISRDASETILKLLFLSQIGSVVILWSKSANNNFYPVKIVLVGGAVIVGFVLLGWAIFFPHFLEILFPTGVGSFSLSAYFLSCMAAFCMFLWIDTIVASILVETQSFRLLHLANFFGAGLSLIVMVVAADATIETLALALASGKAVAVLPKLINIAHLPSDATISSDRVGRDTLFLLRPYISVNTLLQVNKFVYLLGVPYLEGGGFAIYNLVYRYYSAVQNFVTMNLFNLGVSSVRLSLGGLHSKTNNRTLELILSRHNDSFSILLFFLSAILLVVQGQDILKSVLPFTANSNFSVICLLVFFNFYFDGVNLIISRFFIVTGRSRLDSRHSIIQAALNLILLYPCMKFLGVIGLCMATLLVCLIMSFLRIWSLSNSKGLLIKKVLFKAILIFIGIMMVLLRVQDYLIVSCLVICGLSFGRSAWSVYCKNFLDKF